MCTLFLAIGQHPQFPFVLAGNRDEFYKRATQPAGWWPEFPNVYGGRDLAGGGTWLGITKSGRFATLTNYRDLNNLTPNAPTRGTVVSDFLTSDKHPLAYLEEVVPTLNRYNGFNLLVGLLKNERGVPEIWYLHHGQKTSLSIPIKLQSGIYGLSNAALNTPWPKVVIGRSRFADILHKEAPKPAHFLALLEDETIYPDEDLPQTGVSQEWERVLSAMCIRSPAYGTRVNSVLQADHQGLLHFWERTYLPDTQTYEVQDILIQSHHPLLNMM